MLAKNDINQQFDLLLGFRHRISSNHLETRGSYPSNFQKHCLVISFHLFVSCGLVEAFDYYIVTVPPRLVSNSLGISVMFRVSIDRWRT